MKNLVSLNSKFFYSIFLLLSWMCNKLFLNCFKIKNKALRVHKSFHLILNLISWKMFDNYKVNFWLGILRNNFLINEFMLSQHLVVVCVLVIMIVSNVLPELLCQFVFLKFVQKARVVHIPNEKLTSSFPLIILSQISLRLT